MSTASLQTRLHMADKIIQETELLLEKQQEFFKWRRPADLQDCKIRESKLREMIAKWKVKPDLFTREELEKKADELLK